MKKVNIEGVKEASEFSTLPAGGYVCKITNVEDVDNKEYLHIEFDIVYGDYVGYYKELEKRASFWGGRWNRSYKATALPFFKRMCSAISKSNPGFVFDGGEQNSNEKTLIGKYIGLIIGIEEYVSNNGEKREREYVYAEADINDIKNGKFKVPAKRLLSEEDKKRLVEADADTGFMNIPDTAQEEIPFN